MILFYGRRDDSPLGRALDQAEALGVPHLLLDQGQLAGHDLGLAVDAGGWTGRVVAAGQEVSLDALWGVYARPLELPEVRDPIDRLRAQTFHQGLVEWLDTAPCLVVNRPSAMDSNSSKPFQAQLIAQLGFEVPDTLVTNDPAEVVDFQRRHSRVIYKSTSGVRSIVRQLDDAALARLERVRAVPTMFQAHVSGADVRVHVVGEETFATEITTEATDYRYATRDGLVAEMASLRLPEAVEAGCVRLAVGLRLPFCGVDLRRTEDGRWVCFEVNPMPAYSFFEDGTGQAISTSLVRLLAGNCKEPAHAER